MANNIGILNHSECCGCKVCGDVCPIKCIKFNEDSEGFYYPSIDESKCISCGKCIKTCPELNPKFNNQASYAFASYSINQNKREEGSSGGIFGLLAAECINQGGKAWGAAFDKKLQLHHVPATNLENLKPLLRSKYLQSDTSGIYSQILEDIKNGIITLFSGTPCQCNAIRNIVGDSSNLITIEVVCHGVPSQNLFNKCIRQIENKNNCSVKSFYFRSKYKNALHPHAFTYICSSKNKQTIVNGLHYQFPFYFGFQKYMTLRPSCYTCKWATTKRTADITLGDFWGIEKYNSSLNAKTGISQVLLNTTRGEILFNQLISSDQIWSEKFPIETVIENNGCLTNATKLKPERTDFFKDLSSIPFDKVVKKYLTPRRKWIFDLYYSMPKPFRKLIRKIMDKKMRYE